MTLRARQSAFAVALADLIHEAVRRGFEVTVGEVWRSEEEARRLARSGAGIARSLHQDKLAVDLNLFKDGVYLTDVESHRPLGEWWEVQSTPDLPRAWGGRFASGDANHYSFALGTRR